MNPRHPRRSRRPAPSVRSRSEWRAFVQKAQSCARAIAAGGAEDQALMALRDDAIGALSGLFVQGCGMAGHETAAAFIAMAKALTSSTTSAAARALMAPAVAALAAAVDGFLDILQQQAAGAERQRVDIYG